MSLSRAGMSRRAGRLALFVVALAVLFPAVAFAQDLDVERKFRSGPQVTVGTGETIPDDLYASAGRVEVAGRVRGDLVAAGGEISVPGGVDGDVLAAGGRVVINGEVGGDVRVAGGDVRLGGSIGEDVVVAGGTVVIASGAEVGGDVLFSGGQVRLDGRVEGDVLGSSGDYSSAGSIGGSEQVTSGRPEAGPPTVGERILGAVRRYVAILLVGALLLWLAPRVLQAPAAQVRAKPLASLGWGAVAAVGYVVLLVLVLLAAVLVSIVFGLLGLGSLVATLAFGALLAIAIATFVFAIVIAFVADAIVGLVVGGLAWGSADASRGRLFAALALGVALVVIVTAIPFVGGILKLLVVLTGLGALVLAGRSRRAPAPAV